ncbi:hypothetical protein BDR07DRAFT_1393072, partial [Suillus spraguei]
MEIQYTGRKSLTNFAYVGNCRLKWRLFLKSRASPGICPVRLIWHVTSTSDLLICYTAGLGIPGVLSSRLLSLRRLFRSHICPWLRECDQRCCMTCLTELLTACQVKLTRNFCENWCTERIDTELCPAAIVTLLCMSIRNVLTYANYKSDAVFAAAIQMVSFQGRIWNGKQHTSTNDRPIPFVFLENF